ncbi:MAG: FIST N-terminal domain-containing protein [Planctomycetota bacterium]
MEGSIPSLRCAAALSTEPNLDAAVGEVADDLDSQLGGDRPDLTFVFATHHYGGDLARTAAEIVEATGTAALAGCTGGWTVGIGREAETSPGLTVLAATLPQTRVRVAHLAPPAEGGGAVSDLDIDDPTRTGLLLLADPFSFPVGSWLRDFHGRYPDLTLAGGLASGGVAPGQNVLFAGADPVNSGAVAVTLEGETRLLTAVSQGCRPIGPPLVATKVDRNVVLEFRGKPAAKVLFEVIQDLDEEDRKLFQSGPFLGRAIDAAKGSFRSGDLLVRAIMGLDPERHAVAVADDEIRAGTTLQLMVRDRDSARDEMHTQLEDAGLASLGEAAGGLLFTCGGRGQGMFGESNPDAAQVEARFGPGFPLAGFSAAGEIGEVSGEPFLHSFTASAAFFVPRSGGIDSSSPTTRSGDTDDQ